MLLFYHRLGDTHIIDKASIKGKMNQQIRSFQFLMHQLNSFYLLRKFYFCLLLPLKLFVHFHNTFFSFLPSLSLPLTHSFYTRISLVSFIDTALLSVWPLELTYIYACQLTNGRKRKRKKREKERQVFTCKRYEWLMFVIIFFSLSLLPMIGH